MSGKNHSENEKTIGGSSNFLRKFGKNPFEKKAVQVLATFQTSLNQETGERKDFFYLEIKHGGKIYVKDEYFLENAIQILADITGITPTGVISQQIYTFAQAIQRTSVNQEEFLLLFFFAYRQQTPPSNNDPLGLLKYQVNTLFQNYAVEQNAILEQILDSRVKNGVAAQDLEVRLRAKLDGEINKSTTNFGKFANHVAVEYLVEILVQNQNWHTPIVEGGLKYHFRELDLAQHILIEQYRETDFFQRHHEKLLTVILAIPDDFGDTERSKEETREEEKSEAKNVTPPAKKEGSNSSNVRIRGSGRRSYVGPIVPTSGQQSIEPKSDKDESSPDRKSRDSERVISTSLGGEEKGFGENLDGADRGIVYYEAKEGSYPEIWDERGNTFGGNFGENVPGNAVYISGESEEEGKGFEDSNDPNGNGGQGVSGQEGAKELVEQVQSVSAPISTSPSEFPSSPVKPDFARNQAEGIDPNLVASAPERGTLPKNGGLILPGDPSFNQATQKIRTAQQDSRQGRGLSDNISQPNSSSALVDSNGNPLAPYNEQDIQETKLQGPQTGASPLILPRGVEGNRGVDLRSTTPTNNTKFDANTDKTNALSPTQPQQGSLGDRSSTLGISPRITTSGEGKTEPLDPRLEIKNSEFKQGPTERTHLSETGLVSSSAKPPKSKPPSQKRTSSAVKAGAVAGGAIIAGVARKMQQQRVPDSEQMRKMVLDGLSHQGKSLGLSNFSKPEKGSNIRNVRENVGVPKADLNNDTLNFQNSAEVDPNLLQTAQDKDELPDFNGRSIADLVDEVPWEKLVKNRTSGNNEIKPTKSLESLKNKSIVDAVDDYTLEDLFTKPKSEERSQILSTKRSSGGIKGANNQTYNFPSAATPSQIYATGPTKQRQVRIIDPTSSEYKRSLGDGPTVADLIDTPWEDLVGDNTPKTLQGSSQIVSTNNKLNIENTEFDPTVVANTKLPQNLIKNQIDQSPEGSETDSTLPGNSEILPEQQFGTEDSATGGSDGDGSSDGGGNGGKKPLVGMGSDDEEEFNENGERVGGLGGAYDRLKSELDKYNPAKLARGAVEQAKKRTAQFVGKVALSVFNTVASVLTPILIPLMVFGVVFLSIIITMILAYCIPIEELRDRFFEPALYAASRGGRGWALARAGGAIFAGVDVPKSDLRIMLEDQLSEFAICEGARSGNYVCPAGYLPYEKIGNTYRRLSGDGTSGDGSADSGIGAEGVPCLAVPREGKFADPHVRAWARAVGSCGMEAPCGGDVYVGFGGDGDSYFGRYQYGFPPNALDSWGDDRNASGNKQILTSSEMSKAAEESRSTGQLDNKYKIAQDMLFIETLTGRSRGNGPGLVSALRSENKSRIIAMSDTFCKQWHAMCSESTPGGKATKITELFFKLLAEEKSGSCGTGTPDLEGVNSGVALNYNQNIFANFLNVKVYADSPGNFEYNGEDQKVIELIKEGKIEDAVAQVSPTRGSLQNQIKRKLIHPNALKSMITIAESLGKYNLSSMRVTSAYRSDSGTEHALGEKIDVDALRTSDGVTYSHLDAYGGNPVAVEAWYNYAKLLRDVGNIDQIVTAGAIYDRLTSSGEFSGINLINDPSQHDRHYDIRFVPDKEPNQSLNGSDSSSATSENVWCCPVGHSPETNSSEENSEGKNENQEEDSSGDGGGDGNELGFNIFQPIPARADEESNRSETSQEDTNESTENNTNTNTNTTSNIDECGCIRHSSTGSGNTAQSTADTAESEGETSKSEEDTKESDNQSETGQENTLGLNDLTSPSELFSVATIQANAQETDSNNSEDGSDTSSSGRPDYCPTDDGLVDEDKIKELVEKDCRGEIPLTVSRNVACADRVTELLKIINPSLASRIGTADTWCMYNGIGGSPACNGGVLANGGRIVDTPEEIGSYGLIFYAKNPNGDKSSPSDLNIGHVGLIYRDSSGKLREVSNYSSSCLHIHNSVDEAERVYSGVYGGAIYIAL